MFLAQLHLINFKNYEDVEVDQPYIFQVYEKGKPLDKIGQRSADTSELFFEDVRVPVSNRLGEEGRGFIYLMSQLPQERLQIGTTAIAVIERALALTIDYVKERKAFGKPIGAFQMTQAKIADMKCKLDAATLLTLRAAWVKGQGQRFSNEAAIAKLTASEAAMWITHQALQIHGGMGYSKEMPLERYFRDAKITEIYEGTSEIQRLVIARNETGLR